MFKKLFSKKTAPEPVLQISDVNVFKANRDVDNLIKALTFEGNPLIRINAAAGLGEIGDPRAVEPLIALLSDGESSVRSTAVIALAKFQDPRANHALTDLINSGADWGVTNQGVIKELEQIASPIVIELIFKAMETEPSIRWVAAKALANHKDKRVTNVFLAYLDSNEPHLRRESAEILGGIGDPAALPGLLRLLHDEVDFVKTSAAQSLGEIGNPEAVQPLVEALNEPNNRYLIEFRQSAIAALRKLGYTDEIEILPDMNNFPIRTVITQPMIDYMVKQGGTLNFCGCVMHRAYFKGANLRGANFEGADLRLAYLHRADLTGANLRKANLGGAEMRDAILVNADLGDANLGFGEVIDIYGRGESRAGANLAGANLNGANLNGAIMPDDSRPFSSSYSLR